MICNSHWRKSCRNGRSRHKAVDFGDVQAPNRSLGGKPRNQTAQGLQITLRVRRDWWRDDLSRATVGAVGSG